MDLNERIANFKEGDELPDLGEKFMDFFHKHKPGTEYAIQCGPDLKPVYDAFVTHSRLTFKGIQFDDKPEKNGQILLVIRNQDATELEAAMVEAHVTPALKRSGDRMTHYIFRLDPATVQAKEEQTARGFGENEGRLLTNLENVLFSVMQGQRPDSVGQSR